MKNRILLFSLLAAVPLCAQSFSLAELRPNQGMAGIAVNLTVSGSGFSSGFAGNNGSVPGSTIIWRRNSVETRLSTTFVNTNTLTAVIPATLMINAPGAADVFVESGFCDGTCPRTNSLTFTITPPLQLISLNPNRAPTRSANATPQDFLLVGQAFASNAQVFWQGVVGTAFIEIEVLSRASNNQIQARIPPSLLTQPTTATVYVRNPGTSDIPPVISNTLPFTVFPALRLDRLDPPSLPAGSPATKVTAFGQGFGPNTRVGFRDAGGTRTPSLQVVNVGAGTIEVTVGADLLTTQKTWQVIATDGNSVSDPISFLVTAGSVTVTSLSPNTRPAGSGQFELTVNGSGFTDDAVVLLGGPFGSNALTPLSRSATQLRVNVTALDSPGEVTVAVRVGGGTTAVTSNSQILTFTLPAPVISALSPPSRAANSGDFDLTITGRNFTPNPTVTFGGQSVTMLAAPSATSISVRIPNARIPQAGNVPVIVRVNNVDSDGFTFQVTSAGPSISALNPALRPANSGDFDLTIAGQNLTPNPTVTFGGQSVGIVGTPSATSVTVRIPNARIQQTGNVPVVVRVNNVDSDGFTFQVTSAGPSISALNPASRPVNGGDFDLTIAGQNLTPSPTVTFGGQSVGIVGTPTATSVTVRIPNARIQQAGDVSVTVRVNNVESNALTFQVTVAGPTISSLSPTSRSAASGDFTLTINGQNLTPNPSVTFGGQTVSVMGTPSATSIQVQIPNARIQQPGPVEVRVQVGSLSATASFTVVAPEIPAVTVSSPVVDVQPNGNTTTTVVLASPAPVTVTGTLELSFAPNVPVSPPSGYADPALIFVSGGQKRLAFTIPAGQTQAQIPGGGAFNVGTVAGTVTVRVTALSALGVDAATLPPPRTLTIPRTGPSITPGSGRLFNSTGGVTVEVQGYSPTREITQASVTFTIAAGVTSAGSTTFPVPLQPQFTTWFASEAGLNNGSRFGLQILFTVPEGDPNQITGFSITLTNANGTATASGVR